MWGGDLLSEKMIGFDNALQRAKKLIGNDSSKCAVIRRNGNDNCQLWLKNLKRQIHRTRIIIKIASAFFLELNLDYVQVMSLLQMIIEN
jgi:hypothetical protein